ncbi:MAG: molybdopterin-dependent oxidoreductase [Nitrospira sp.]
MTTIRNSIEDIWGSRTPYRGEWPERSDSNVEGRVETWVPSACVLCSNGCGVEIGVKDGKIVGIRGRSDDRVNRGRLGPKGLYGWKANASPERLTRPLIQKEGRFHEVSWDEAMDVIVRKSQDIRQHYTAGAIGFYTSGQLFLEEYYTLGVIGKAGLGTPHMDGNTRLCTATSSAALKESFGCDGQPGSYNDIDTTDALFNFGHNVAEQQTVLWMRMLDRLSGANPPKLVVVDPRPVPAALKADVHLAPKPGANVAIMNGLLHLLIKHAWVDHSYLSAHTIGFEQLENVVADCDPCTGGAGGGRTGKRSTGRR